jgi:3,4-dihydroxy 2-butanone 4-phosphate synthase/GTP cyclohydrolase II
VLDDVLGDTAAGKAEDLHRAMRLIGKEGRGVIVLIREPHRAAMSDRVRAKKDNVKPQGTELRDYGVGAQILLDLGIKEMTLLSNTKRTLIGFEGWGLSIAGQRPLRDKGE